MKTLTKSIILISMMLIAGIDLSAQVFSGGNGTSEDPYQITTPVQLDSVRNHMNDCFILMNDLDMSGIDPFTPLGKPENLTTEPVNSFTVFQGVFDGNGKKITNLNMVYHGNYVGLFAVSAGVVKNLGVYGNLTVYENNTGALIVGYLGQNDAPGIVENCWAEGTVFADSADVTANGQYALIVGTLAKPNCIIRYCYAKGQIINNGGKYVGGITGRFMNKEASLHDCFSEVDIISASSYVGGITGQVYSQDNVTANMSNCYATGTIVGTDNVGGVAGWIYKLSKAESLVAINDSVVSTMFAGNAGRVTGQLYGDDTETGVIANAFGISTAKVLVFGTEQTITSNSDGKDGEDTSDGDLKDQSFYTSIGWDFDNVWMMSVDGYPMLKVIDGYLNPVGIRNAVVTDEFEIFSYKKDLYVRGLNDKSTIRVFDITGKKVIEAHVVSSEFVKELPSTGIYIINVASGNKYQKAKIISVE